MKKIKQTKLGIQGNCLAAAIASIFEIEISDVPDLNPYVGIPNDFQDDILNLWLYEKNLKYIEFRLDKTTAIERMNGVHHLICGKSPRNANWSHAVVGYDGSMVHDPHPSNSGLGKQQFYAYGIFVKANPCKE